MLPFKEPQGDKTQYGSALQPQELWACSGRLLSSPSPSGSQNIPGGLPESGRPPDTAPHPPSGVKCREHSQSWTGREVAWSVLSCRLPLCPQGCPSRSRQGWWQQVPAFQRGPGWPGREGTECVNPFMSILSVPAESCRRAPSFEHTHRSHTVKVCTRECTYTLTLRHAEILTLTVTQAPLTPVRQWKSLIHHAFPPPRGPLSPRAGGGVGAGPPALSSRVPLIFIKALKASPLASQAFD